MNTAPIITLLTDFGTQDVYVGVMKGVILSRCPAAVIVDLTHHVAQGDIHAAGYLLDGAFTYFPAGTVHTVVVDPGVGTDRRLLAAQAGGHVFVAPDNGVLSGVLNECKPTDVVSVEKEELFCQPTSRTFHGRDIFAPVAAALACGARLDDLGPAIDSWIHLPRPQPSRDESGALIGEVIYIDRFGNLVTNLRGDDLPEDCVIEIDGHAIGGIRDSYASVNEGQALAIIGSTGRIEVSVNHGHAASAFGVSIGDPVHVKQRGRPGSRSVQ